MNRIAAATIVAAAALAIDSEMPPPAFAEAMTIKAPATQPEAVTTLGFKGSRLMSLLMVLETLRQSPLSLDPQKG